MPKIKILVLTDHMPWGHRSIARSLYQEQSALTDPECIELEYLEFKTNTTGGGAGYTLISRYFPASHRLFHQLSKPRISREVVRQVSKINLPSLKKKIEEIKPDLIICTYFLLTDALQSWREKESTSFALWTVVPDPWTCNPVAFTRGCDLHIVYDERAAEQAREHGIEPDKILVTGWWTRPEMFRTFDKSACRQKLGIGDDRPVIFVGGGSLGTAAVTRLLPTLLFLKKDVQFIINTGTDKGALKNIERFVRILKRFRKDDRIRILTLGWIDNMAEVLAATDIVFGKAGPNFLFDCVACRKPFVAVTHIGGQEDGNIDLIREKEIGWVREKRPEMVRFLKDYLERPAHYEQLYADNIEREARINQKSATVIAERIRCFQPPEAMLRIRVRQHLLQKAFQKLHARALAGVRPKFRLKPRIKLKPTTMTELRATLKARMKLKPWPKPRPRQKPKNRR